MTTHARIPMVADSTTCPHDGGELTHSIAYNGRILYVRCLECRCRWSLSGKLQRYGTDCRSRRAA